jgi:hypothetical protein
VPSLSTSCQVREDGGERRGRPTTTSQSRSSTNKYGTARQVWSLRKFKQLQLTKQQVRDRHVWSPREVQTAVCLLFQHLAKSVRTVVREEGDRQLRHKVAAQRTSTGQTAKCRVSVSSSSYPTSLPTSCQVCEDSSERRGRPTSSTRSCSSMNNAYGTTTCGVPVRFKQLRNFSFDILPSP